MPPSETSSLPDAKPYQKKLDRLYDELKAEAKRCLGYPCNHAFDYSEIYRFLNLAMNNVGDPFQDSTYALNTLELEREVIEIFAELTHLPQEELWGYVTNGGTEGNMYGLYLAREMYPNGMVYFSEHTHYSVAKILRLQHTPSIMIKAQENGEMDYDDLAESLLVNRDVPPIIFANIGTTMTGAIDDLDRIRGILKEQNIENAYIHADAALHGLGLAFIDNPPPWDFAAGIDSLSISGHKWFGAPIPCGICLARMKHVDRISRAVEYVGVNDTTITGSRSAFSPLMLWYGLKKKGNEEFKNMIRRSIDLAQFTVDAFQKHGINAWRNLNSPIVIFPRPSKQLVKRWSLAVDGEIAHIVCLDHMEKQIIQTFVDEYCQAD